MTESITTGLQPPSAQSKQRHGCLAAFLLFMLVANAGVCVFYIVALLGGGFLAVPLWGLAALIVMGSFNVACVVALFKWKKWGFWGFFASAVIVTFINLAIGVGAGSAGGFIGVVILYLVLQIGDKDKGWPQLE